MLLFGSRAQANGWIFLLDWWKIIYSKHRLIFQLCVCNTLTALCLLRALWWSHVMHHTTCFLTMSPFTHTVLHLRVCVCVSWFNRTFPGEPSVFGGQTVCCPPWCLCRELALWEQLFREQILINRNMLEVCVYFPVWCLIFLCCRLYFSTVAWPLPLSAQGQTCTNLQHATSLVANKTEQSSQRKISLRSDREWQRDLGMLGFCCMQKPVMHPPTHPQPFLFSPHSLPKHHL